MAKRRPKMVMIEAFFLWLVFWVLFRQYGTSMSSSSVSNNELFSTTTMMLLLFPNHYNDSHHHHHLINNKSMNFNNHSLLSARPNNSSSSSDNTTHIDEHGTLTTVGRTITTNSSIAKNNFSPPYLLREDETNTTVVYSEARPDGSGMVIRDMLAAHAFAWKHGYKYGGCCLVKLGPARIRRREINAAFLREVGLDRILVYACPKIQRYQQQQRAPPVFMKNPKNIKKNNDNDYADFYQVPLAQRKQLLMPVSVYNTHDTPRIWTPDWIQYVQQFLKYNDNDPAGNTLKVAVHVRRKDITPCKPYAHRYLPNSYYIQVLEQYLPQVTLKSNRDPAKTAVDVHVFTDQKDNDNDDGSNNHKHAAESLNEFRRRGFHVHTPADDSTMGAVWRALWSANLTIASRSTFSLVPSAFSRSHGAAVVVYPGNFFMAPLPHWTIVNVTLQEQAHKATQVLAQTVCRTGAVVAGDATVAAGS